MYEKPMSLNELAKFPYQINNLGNAEYKNILNYYVNNIVRVNAKLINSIYYMGDSTRHDPTTSIIEARSITPNYKEEYFPDKGKNSVNHIVYDKTKHIEDYSIDRLPNRFIVHESAATARCLLLLHDHLIEHYGMEDVLYTNMRNHPPYPIEEHEGRVLLNDPIAKAFDWLELHITNYKFIFDETEYDAILTELITNTIKAQHCTEYVKHSLTETLLGTDEFHRILEIYLEKPSHTFKIR